MTDSQKNNTEFYKDLHDRGWTAELEFRGPTMLIRDFVMERQVARHMPNPDASIMDLGCADFGLLLRMRRRHPNAQLFGADITDRSFRARAKDAGIQHRTFDISRETWPQRRCHIITAVDMLEHVEDDDAALRNIRSMLAPGGRFIFHLPFSSRYWSAHDESVGHFRRYTAETMSDKLSAAGFSDFSMFTYGFPFMTTYFKMVLSRVAPERTQKRKSSSDRLITYALYALFRMDALFADPKCTKGFCLVGSAG